MATQTVEHKSGVKNSEFLEIFSLSPMTKGFKISRPEGFDFAAGQFISLVIPRGHSSLPLQRSYTIVSVPEEKRPV